jgi:hypothetical protein
MAVPRLYDPAGLTRPDPVRAVAAALAAHVAPGDPVWVVNYPPVVHVLAGAGLSTRYVFPQHLTGAHAAVTGIDADAEVRRILDSRPAALVVYRGWWLQVRPALRPVIEAALAGSRRSTRRWGRLRSGPGDDRTSAPQMLCSPDGESHRRDSMLNAEARDTRWTRAECGTARRRTSN